MPRLTILIVAASFSTAMPAMPFGRAPRNGLMRSGRPLSTFARGRSQTITVNSRIIEATSLAEYCAGAPEVSEQDRVMANWKGYGTYYPGSVDVKNNDGSIDVTYDDGWTEPHVPQGSFKPAEAKETKKRDDAACDLAEDVTAIKEKVVDAGKNIAVWLASQRAAWTGTESEGPSPATAPVAAAPSPADVESAASAQASSEEANELQKLKDEIDDVNGEIASAEAKLQSNAKTLTDLSGEGLSPNGTSRPKTVEDLLAEYRARLAERKEVLRELKEQIREQEQQMAAVGAAKISLEDIQADVKDIISDMQDIKARRDKLALQDRLDSELRAAVDSMLGFGGTLQGRITSLFDAKEKADAARKEAEAARKAAVAKAQAEAARKAAEAEAERKAAKTAEEKAKAAKKAAEAEEARKQAEAAKKSAEANTAAEQAAEDAEKEAFKAGEEVETELKMVSKETETLDSGVHPNGNKWWRYRYEHSFVEALMMIFISALMLFYEKLFNWLRFEVYAKSKMRATIGTLYTVWLEFASLQMLACLVVFLTIWLLDHCHVFDLLARDFPGSEFMRLPVAGSQYRKLAFDICVCLIMSLLFYFVLMFSVVHAAMNKMRSWALSDRSETEDERHRDEDEGDESTRSVGTVSTSNTVVEAAHKLKKAITFYGTADEFKQRKRYFVKHMAQHLPKLRSPRSESGMQMSEEMMMERFPFWKYLRANVRSTMMSFLELGTPLWLGVIVTFVVLLFLHHVLHMGYIRVMTFFLVVQCATLGLSMLMIYKVNSVVESELTETEDDEDDESRLPSSSLSQQLKEDKRMSIAYHIKHGVLFMLQYTLFFLCYGVARSICQPWMWKLHFWLVLGITMISAVLTVIFVLFVSPLMTSFAASMAMPPYLDNENMAKMVEVIDDLREDTMTSKDFVKLGSQSF
mmetsp:Transcript_148026/g.256953  ORF Transcript_148026/g.256953 Transcript_148026/m.256953 type:complete len:920 (+) Transcript_148026:156-2915(+)